MAVPAGSLARGEVQVFPYTLTVTTGTRVTLDLTPGLYDLFITINSNLVVSAGTPQWKVEAYTNEAQTQVEVMYTMSSTHTTVVSVVTPSATVNKEVVVVPRGTQYIPFTLPYGLRIRHVANGSTCSGSYGGFVVARRR
jgi:hypothetical protein